ncbi:hypothetical protein [Kyrpidia tusciae]|uniref:Uncharacterized protein n=1 Tax=Kyrpidia tusciae (strain DSM 2912 / NBRC 15312 / T2) TaxID=562970 RepID=D5WX03_KYRT2|nr:hypothetical protein [Kyrpidia tusciae]ADG05854.1 hypothetical protein Btus_1117 [Kyrpidia tusciae DSM 2912]
MDWDRFDEMLGQCGVRVRFTKAAAGRERDSAHRELARLVKIKSKSANLGLAMALGRVREKWQERMRSLVRSVS